MSFRVVEVVNTMAKYRHRQYAAEGLLNEDGRQCGSKQTVFGYHPLSRAAGDFAAGVRSIP